MKIAEKLFNLAENARKNAYSPYSKFKVGAAIYANNQEYYASCNVENVSFPCGTCAEAGVISEMIANGGSKILEILIIADSNSLISPCGACLQRIKEFSDEETIIHLANHSGIQKSLKISDFLPLAFDEKELRL
ncbi:MAG: cytidine deaminase [Alphaproteobacteria bacterium]